jgi:hypothetical protein
MPLDGPLRIFSLPPSTMRSLAAAAALAAASASSAVHGDLKYIDFAPSAAPQFTLQMLKDTTRGSACIDGSPYGVYVSPGQGSNLNNWMIYFQVSGVHSWRGRARSRGALRVLVRC